MKVILILILICLISCVNRQSNQIISEPTVKIDNDYVIKAPLKTDTGYIIRSPLILFFKEISERFTDSLIREKYDNGWIVYSPISNDPVASFHLSVDENNNIIRYNDVCGDCEHTWSKFLIKKSDKIIFVGESEYSLDNGSDEKGSIKFFRITNNKLIDLTNEIMPFSLKTFFSNKVFKDLEIVSKVLKLGYNIDHLEGGNKISVEIFKSQLDTSIIDRYTYSPEINDSIIEWRKKLKIHLLNMSNNLMYKKIIIGFDQNKELFEIKDYIKK